MNSRHKWGIAHTNGRVTLIDDWYYSHTAVTLKLIGMIHADSS